MASYNHVLEITGYESIEMTLRTGRLFLWAGTLIRMSNGRLPKRTMFGTLEGATRRGRGRKEKEWTDWVQSDIWAFGIARNWKSTALKAAVWIKTVPEGGRRLIAPRGREKRKTRLDIVRRREKQRDWESCYRTRKRRILQSDTLWPSRRVKGILVRTTRDRSRPA